MKAKFISLSLRIPAKISSSHIFKIKSDSTMNVLTNYLKTAFLLFAMTSLTLMMGFLIGGESGLMFALIFSIIMNFSAYWFSDKLAIRYSGAKEVSERDYPELYQDVRDLSQKMGIPMPKVYISPESQPNAFATGRNPKNSAVCFTQGLMNFLNRDEIAGVIAHELAHIKNRDILISSIAAMLAGVLSSLSNIFIFTGGGGRENRNPFLTLILLMITPIIAMILQFAISRSREFSADALAVQTTKNPQGLANALEKIENLVMRNPMEVKQGYESMYIQSPISRSGFNKLFSTHPPTAERVNAIYNLKI